MKGDKPFPRTSKHLSKGFINLVFFHYLENKSPGPVPALLDWPVVHSKMAWSVVIVLGGGFALADATKVSV